MPLNIIDIALIVVVLLSVVHGWQRGFICGSFDLARWIVSLLAALRFYQPVGLWLGHLNPWSDVWNQPIAFLLIAIICSIVIHLVGLKILRRLPKDLHKRKINKLFGTLPGLVNGLIAASIIAAILLAVPLNEGLRERVRNSSLANRLAGYTETLEAALSPVFERAISETLNLITIQPESSERLSLPYTVAEPQPKPELEARMLELVNNERTTAGLQPMVPDPELTEVARQHSADMFKRGYFAHVTPENRSPFDRIREADIRFLTAGENLALAPTVQIAHAGLMKSPGHRANILRPTFGRVGIGIMDGGIHGLMVTQDFRN